MVHWLRRHKCYAKNEIDDSAKQILNKQLYKWKFQREEFEQ